MKVSDVFQKKVGYTTSDASLLEAAKFIFGHGHQGIPVVKKPNNKLIGFITEQDILSELFPKVSDLFEDYIHERDFERMEKNIKPILSKKVKEVMSKKVVFIHVEDALLKAEAVMKLRNIARLPVVNDKGNLIGIISKVDIFRALVNRKLRGFK